MKRYLVTGYSHVGVSMISEDAFPVFTTFQTVEYEEGFHPEAYPPDTTGWPGHLDMHAYHPRIQRLRCL